MEPRRPVGWGIAKRLRHTATGSIALALAAFVAKPAGADPGVANPPVASPPVAAPPPGAAKAPPANHLTDDERAAGFVLLFDGRTGKGWRGYQKTGFPEVGWRIENGTLLCTKGNGQPRGGDLISTDQFDDFELRAEFRLTPGANSGIKYLVVEAPERKAAISFEYQVLDDERHPDAKLGKAGNRTMAGLYDLIAPTADKATRPIGSWNEARIVVEGNRVQHWLNGKQTVAFERQSPALRALIAGSKYHNVPDFGEHRRGHILLQDHGDEVAFRSIRLRRLGPAKPASNGASKTGPGKPTPGTPH